MSPSSGGTENTAAGTGEAEGHGTGDDVAASMASSSDGSPQVNGVRSAWSRASSGLSLEPLFSRGLFG